MAFRKYQEDIYVAVLDKRDFMGGNVIITTTNNVTEVVKAANKIGHPKISENYYDGFREASAISRE